MPPSPGRSVALRDAVERAYVTFAGYERPAAPDFCAHCYDEQEIAYLRTTDLREFDEHHARRITWETSDHWDSTALYKHYLPRILDALAPPDRCDDLYPEHLFEVLDYHRFHEWPEGEQRAVLSWIQAVAEELEVGSAEDAEEWRAAAAQLHAEPAERP